MNPAGMPPARRIAPLVVLVAALHGWLLTMQPEALVSPSARTVPAFATRQVAVPEPPAPPPAPPRPQAQPRPSAERPPAAEPPQAAATPQAHPAAPVTSEVPARVPPRVVPPSDLRYSHLTPPPPPAPPPEPLGAVPPHAAAIPVPVKIHYDVEVTTRGVALNGRAELHWRHDGNRYDARLEIGGALLPTRVQTSSGIVTREGLQPLRFSDKYRSEEATHFERDKGKVTFSSNRPPAELLAGAQDRLSIVLQLAAMVGGNPALYPPGTSIAIPTAGTRESETWVFTVEGEEDLRLPMGALRGLRLQRQPRKEYDTRVELWLAPQLDYAPVRLRLTYPNGDSVDQRWSSADKG